MEYVYKQKFGEKNDWKMGTDFTKDNKPIRYDMAMVWTSNSSHINTGLNKVNPNITTFTKMLIFYRHLDDPTADGKSLDHISQYKPGHDVHHSSGIFNKAFYNLANSADWDIMEAFQVSQ